MLDRLSVKEYFSCAVGGDTTTARKPDSLPLLSCLEMLGVDPARGTLSESGPISHTANLTGCSTPDSMNSFGKRMASKQKFIQP